MAVTTLGIGYTPQKGINYTVITDSSADWASVPNSTYFYDKTDKLPHYKDGSGNILEVFSASNSGTVTSVAALTLGTTGTDLSSSVATGTTTPVITLNVPTASATNRGVLSSADWTTFNNKGNGTVTSVGLLTGSTGVDVNVSGGPITGSGSITLNIPTASATNRGALSAADWSTFNSKANTASPAFTGTPTSTTAASGTNTTQIATTAFVQDAITKQPEVIQAACSDETTALTAGTGKLTFRMPYAMTLTAVRASLVTAQTSGAIFTINVKQGGVTLFSTKPTINNGSRTTVGATTPSVLSTTALTDDSEITVDIDQIGDGTAKGLKITLIGTRV